MEKLKKTGSIALYFLVTGFMLTLYIACRIMATPMFWKGQQDFKFWIQDKDSSGFYSQRTKQITSLLIILFLLFTWHLFGMLGIFLIISIIFGMFIYSMVKVIRRKYADNKN